MSWVLKQLGAEPKKTTDFVGDNLTAQALEDSLSGEMLAESSTETLVASLPKNLPGNLPGHLAENLAEAIASERLADQVTVAKARTKSRPAVLVTCALLIAACVPLLYKNSDRLAKFGNPTPAESMNADRRTASLPPTDAEIRRRVAAANHDAVALFRAGSFAEAAAEFRKLRKSAPHDPVLIANLAAALRRQGELTQAQAELEGAEPTGLILNELGLVLLDRQQWSKAQAAFARSRAVAPDLNETYLHLAKLAELSGKYGEAARNYARFLAGPVSDPLLRGVIEQRRAKLNLFAGNGNPTKVKED